MKVNVKSMHTLTNTQSTYLSNYMFKKLSKYPVKSTFILETEDKDSLHFLNLIVWSTIQTVIWDM